MKPRFLCVLLLPAVLLSGCIITRDVTREAIHGSTAFAPDKIDRVEKAFLTPEGKLIVLLDGRRAECSTNGPFTMTIALPAEPEASWTLVRREDVTSGWNSASMERRDLAPVALGPPVSVARENIARLHNPAGADRMLYPIKESWANDTFWLVATGPPPSRCQVVVQNYEFKRPHRYPLLLLIPLTVPADLVLLPYEIYGMFTFGDRVPHVEPPVK